ncbi:MAG: ATP-binding protein [Burkholderiales bacterium]
MPLTRLLRSWLSRRPPVALQPGPDSAERALAAAEGFLFALDLVAGRLTRGERATRLGLPREELAADITALFRAVPLPQREAALHLAAQAAADGAVLDLEVPVAVPGEGEALRHLRIVGHLARDAGGRLTRIEGLCLEVTSARRARRALERVSTRFQLAADAGRLGLWELDLRNQTVVQTDLGASLFGMTSGEPAPVAAYLDRMHPEDRGRVEQAFLDTIAHGQDLGIVFRVTAGPRLRWVRTAGRLERNDSGRAVRVAGVNWEITDDIEARERIREAGERLGLALAAANASVWEYFRDRARVVWDERGADLYGTDPNLAGSRIGLVHPEDRTRIATLIADSVLDSSARDFVFEYRILHPVRGLRWLRCIGRREVTPDGARRSIGIDIDVTAEHTATEAIEEARRAAEAASRAKSAFLANMSHEIRTPMNAIIGMTGLAHQAGSLAQSSSYAAQAHSAARSLLTVLNDVLDFSRIEAGRLEPERIEYGLEEMLSPVLDVAGFGAGEKRVALLVEFGPEVPARCIGDPSRIAQILFNLAGNAVKFTERGFVAISVSATGARLRFEVTDSGIGLTPAQQREVFEPFIQGDISTSRRFGGTGLGLSICRRLAELMGGELGVRSRAEGGSVFWLDLPLQPVSGAGPVWGTRRAGRDVLVLHHDPVVARSLSAQVARLCARASSLTDLEALAGWLRLQAPGAAPLLCVDARLLPADAGAWLAGLRAHPSRPTVALIARRLSALPTADTVLLEPVLPIAWQRSLGLDSSARGPAPVEAAAAPRPLRAGMFAGKDILLVEDNDLNRALVLAILADAGAHIRIAGNGLEAIAAVRERRPDVVLMDIHMPEMDGYGATAAIRALGAQGRDLPIIATTADALESDRDRALRAGMNDYLTKPLEPSRLVEVLLRWIGASSAAEAPAPGPAAAGAALAPPAPVAAGSETSALAVTLPPVLDLAEGLRGCLGREALLAQTLGIFLDVYGPVPERLAEADTAAQADAGPDLRRLAHTLKGSVRTLGMVRLADVAAALDAELRTGVPPSAAHRATLATALRLTLDQAARALARLRASSG